MKAKPNYKLNTVAGENILVNVGNDSDAFNGVIMLNGTGAFLWKMLENGTEHDEMVAALLEEYEVDEPTAIQGVDDFIESIKKADLCE